MNKFSRILFKHLRRDLALLHEYTYDKPKTSAERIRIRKWVFAESKLVEARLK